MQDQRKEGTPTGEPAAGLRAETARILLLDVIGSLSARAKLRLVSTVVTSTMLKRVHTTPDVYEPFLLSQGIRSQGEQALSIRPRR